MRSAIATHAGFVGVEDDHGELVPAEPGDAILRGRAGAAVGELDQQVVADLVAEGVVDLLEVVEVEEHEAERLAVGAVGVQRRLSSN